MSPMGSINGSTDTPGQSRRPPGAAPGDVVVGAGAAARDRFDVPITFVPQLHGEVHGLGAVEMVAERL